MSDGPRPIVPGLARRLRRHVRPDPHRAPRGRRGGRRGARARAGPVRPGRRAAAQAGPRDHAGRATGWRWSSWRSPATRGSRSTGSSSTAPGRRTRSTRSRRCTRRGRRPARAPDLVAHPVGRGVPRADDLARAATRSSSWPASRSRRATATRTPDRTSSADAPARTSPTASTFLDGPRLRLSASELRAPGRGRSIAALPRPGCGRGLHRRPCAVPRPTGGPPDRDRTRHAPDATIAKTAPRADGLPKRATAAPAAERPPLELARRIVELAEDKKAADIVLLDLAGLTTMADYFVICSGGSERQLDGHRRRDHRQPARREDQADRPRGDRRLALGPGRLRVGHRPHLHAARSATTTASRSTGPRRRRSCASSSATRAGAGRGRRRSDRSRSRTGGGGTVGSCRARHGARS